MLQETSGERRSIGRAKKGQIFAYYVKYLADEGHIPPKATGWVDHIRDKGNEANHENELMRPEDAKGLIRFSEMILRIMYEYPAEAEAPNQKARASQRVSPGPLS